MSESTSIALNILAIIFTSIISYYSGKNKNEMIKYHVHLITLAISVFLALDCVYLYFSGSSDPNTVTILTITKSLYFIDNSLIVYMWVRFVIYIIWGEQYRKQKILYVFLAIFLFNTSFTIANLFSPIIFTISNHGQFVPIRPFIVVFTFFNYLSIFIISVVFVIKRKLIDKNFFLPILVFMIPPWIAETIQLIFKDMDLNCAYAISSLLVFQLAQFDSMYKDPLTGLANRRLLFDVFDKWYSTSRVFTIYAIMIDIDDLKITNDTYGHIAGDKAIKAVADIMLSIKEKNVIPIRFGGDEFLLLWRTKNEKENESVINQLITEKRLRNENKPEDEKVHFSYGEFKCRSNELNSIDDFIKTVDNKLYEQKQLKKKKKITEKCVENEVQ